MFFSKVIRLVTIVLRNCGEMFFLELHHLVNLGTNGLLGCGLALVRAMALKKLAISGACPKRVMIAGELVLPLYLIISISIPTSSSVSISISIPTFHSNYPFCSETPNVRHQREMTQQETAAKGRRHCGQGPPRLRRRHCD
jgi:hypothetical protein